MSADDPMLDDALAWSGALAKSRRRVRGRSSVYAPLRHDTRGTDNSGNQDKDIGEAAAPAPHVKGGGDGPPAAGAAAAFRPKKHKDLNESNDEVLLIAA